MTLAAEPLTPAEQDRLLVVGAQLSKEMQAAFAQCPGQTSVVLALMHYERGIASAETTVRRIQRALGLASLEFEA